MSQIIYIHPQKYLSSTTDAEKSSEANWQSPVPKPGYTPILKADLPTLKYSLQKFLSQKSTSHRLSPIDNSRTGEPDSSGSTSTHKPLTSSASANGSSDTNGVEEGKDGAIPVLYRPIGQFLPLMLGQQLLTIAIRGIPVSVTNQKIEKFLLEVLKLVRTDDSSRCLIDGWTNIVSPGLDIQEVYVRFSGCQVLQNQNMSKGKSSSEKDDTAAIAGIAKNMKFFIDLFANSGPLSVHADENSNRFIEDFCAKTDYKAPDSDLSDKFQDLVNALLSLTGQNDSKSGDVVRSTGTSKTSGSDDTIEYHVDLSKLGDIPRDFLAQLCRDIVEFRTRVITIEREKLARETYLESVRRREQVMRIFEKIRRSKSGHKPGGADDQNDNGSKEVEGDDNDFDSVEDIDDTESVDDDYSAEQARISKEKRESELRYENLLRNFNTVIEPRIRLLRSDIEKAQNYEMSLLHNRSLNLKEIVNLGKDPYYDSRRSYKEMEEELDAVDREKHGDQDKYILETMEAASKVQEINFGNDTGSKTTEDKLTENSQATTSGISIKFSLKKATDKVTSRTTNTDYQTEQKGETTEENEQETRGPEATGDSQGTRAPATTSSADSILQFSDADLSSRLQKLRESRFVDELVNEYLGVYEDELVEFIFENIAENKSRQVLLDDLRETFDNDAEIMVDKIWSREELQ